MIVALRVFFFVWFSAANYKRDSTPQISARRFKDISKFPVPRTCITNT